MNSPDYDNSSLESRISLAQEMAGELRDKTDQVGVLLMQISDRLRPHENADSADHASWRLAQIAEELVCDAAQEGRLRDCLESIGRTLKGASN